MADLEKTVEFEVHAPFKNINMSWKFEELFGLQEENKAFEKFKDPEHPIFNETSISEFYKNIMFFYLIALKSFEYYENEIAITKKEIKLKIPKSKFKKNKFELYEYLFPEEQIMDLIGLTKQDFLKYCQEEHEQTKYSLLFEKISSAAEIETSTAEKNKINNRVIANMETLNLISGTKHSERITIVQDEVPCELYALTAKIEQHVLDKIGALCSLIDCAFFDYTHIFKDEKEEATDDAAVKLLLNNVKYVETLNKKKNYLIKKRQNREKYIYKAISADIYGLNLLKTDDFPLEKGWDIINWLVQEEFGDYCQSERFKEYVELVKTQKDLQTNAGPAAKTIDSKIGSEAAFEYLELFSDKRNRSAGMIQLITSSEFTTLWSTAYENGWSHQLTDISEISDLAQSVGVLEELEEKQTNSLFMLLKSSEKFREYYKKKKPVDNTACSELSEIIILSRPSFDSAIDVLDGKDESFLQCLKRLVSSNGGIKLDINSRTKEFIASLGNFPMDARESLVSLINSYSSAELAVKFDIVPSEIKTAKNIAEMDIEEKLKLADWFARNQAKITEQTEELEEVVPYLANSNSKALQHAILALKKKLGKENFEKANLAEFMKTGIPTYLRIVSLLAVPSVKKEIYRKKEIRKQLMHLALSAEESKWIDFRKELSHIASDHAARYDKILNNYGASVLWEGAVIEETFKGTRKTTEAYMAVKESHPNYINRMIELNEKTDLCANIFERVCKLLKEGHLKSAELAVSQLEKGMPEKAAKNILDLYRCDEDIEAIPIEESGITMYPLAVKREAEEKLPEYDYTSFNTYILSRLFEKQESYTDEQLLAPQHVRDLVEYGFKLKSAGKFIGENYLPVRNIKNNVKSKIEPFSEDYFKTLLLWLVDENAVIFHTKKGRKFSDAVMSLNNHVKEISAEPLREYLTHALYTIIRNPAG
jgi:hypothetical protein